VHKVITDTRVPPAMVAALEARGIQVIVV